MRVQVYPHGGDADAAIEFNLPPDEAVKAYLREADDNDITEVIVEPIDDEARALPGWHAPEGPDDEPFRMYRVAAEVAVRWIVEEVETFRPEPKAGS